jgi:hypothetical protein
LLLSDALEDVVVGVDDLERLLAASDLLALPSSFRRWTTRQASARVVPAM